MRAIVDERYVDVDGRYVDGRYDSDFISGGSSNASSFKLAVAATPAVLSSGRTTEAPAEKRSQGATTVVSACNNI